MSDRSAAIVSPKGALRWEAGHPWIFRSDIVQFPVADAQAVRVQDRSGRPLGWALWSPHSEISLRLLERDAGATIDSAWWRASIERAAARRQPLQSTTNAYRVVHGEADGMPSLVCDRYDQWLVVQLLSAGLEHYRADICKALVDVTGAAGLLARNDAGVRDKEGLSRTTELLHGDVPREIEVREGRITYLAAPWTGQKTGAFLDQRDNRLRMGHLSRGRALDCFSYHGSFALHLARHATSVVAIDSSGEALLRATANAQRNGCENIAFVEANAFDYVREAEQAGDRFDTIVVDPPAFAKNKGTLASALRGYHEINFRAMRLLAPGGLLFTASCSYHLTKPRFLEMLEGAAADSGRRLALREIWGQPLDHPEILSIPETGYLKGALLEAMD